MASVTCTADNLMELSKCLQGLSQGQLMAVQAELMCEYANIVAGDFREVSTGGDLREVSTGGDLRVWD